MELCQETANTLVSFKEAEISTNVSASNQQRKKITSNNTDKNDQYDQEDLTCMVEGCSAMGEEVIALLDEASLSDVDRYEEHDDDDDASKRNNFKNKKSDNNNSNLIPAIVCRKHFDKLIEAYYWRDLKVVKNK
jgi:hypothetical protein